MKLIIDNISYDPLFILGITQDDTIAHITKEYRKKAKLLHPDRLSEKDKLNPNKVLKRSKQFKLLVDCYEFVLNKKQIGNSHRNAEIINVPEYENLEPKIFDNKNELRHFNQTFKNMTLDKPTDFGYTTDRMSALSDNGENYKDLQQEYQTSSFKPSQLFNKKNFNPQDFNKAFEYQQQLFTDGNDEKLVIHKTSDGFNGYNSATLDGCASVSSYDGVMIVGDNFGKSGLGYNEGNYSDYKQSYNTPQNPNSLNIPSNFSISTHKQAALSKGEIQKQLYLREQNININNKSDTKGSRLEFERQQEILLKKQKMDMQNKINQDKDFVLQYKHLFIEDSKN
jgi:curved DNA-binding protein CbpA